MSMKASLEVRSPFIDHRIVELANKLEPSRKLNGTQGKWILHQRLGHWLPKEILSRPKSGFEMPLGVWLRSDLKDWAYERLFSWTDTSPWVNAQNLRNVWAAHQTGRLDCTETLWYHLVFATWLRKYHG
jgi:asparagine synthase (glutamine-hydrolysing)